MPEEVGYGDRKPNLTISLDFLTPSKRRSKSKKYGEEEDEDEQLSYAELARKRLARKKRK
jgi:hypothetical protein